MSTIAFDQFALTRIADFARSLSRLHQASRRQLVDRLAQRLIVCRMISWDLFLQHVDPCD